MKFRSILFVWFLLVFSEMAFAGTTGILKGKVVDKTTREPLIGANVILADTKFGAATDEQGNFVIYNIPAGIYRVKVMMIGYQPYIVENVHIIMDLKTELNIQMTEIAVDLGKEVVVTAERPLIQKDITGTMHAVSADKINQLPVDSYLEVIGLQPGVTSDLHIRGGRTTEVLYLVDGLPIQENIRGNAAAQLPQKSIAEMTIQTGGFNAEYGNAMSGVVNIVTRQGGKNKDFYLRALDDRIGYEKSNHRTEIELMTGGPVWKDRIGYFVSTNVKISDTRWWQDLQKYFKPPMQRSINAMGKLNFNFSDNFKIVAQAIISDNFERQYEYRWRYNLDGLPPINQRSLRLSGSITHTLSDKTFYTLKFSRYQIHKEMKKWRKDQVEQMEIYQYELPWYYFVFKGNRLWWQDVKEINYLLKGDFVSQYHPIAQLKTGFEFQYFYLQNDLVKYEPQKSFWGKPLLEAPLLNFNSYYHYKPYKGSFYLQNKIDNDIVVMNLGLRYDFLNPRAQRPMVEWIPVTNEDYRQQIKGWAPASVKSQWSPRIGFSFPITKDDFIFINYGFFFQMPMFDYLFTGLNFNLKKGVKALYGNPDLKPEKTKAIEVSYKHTFLQDWLFSFTYFNKDISGLVDTKTFLASDSKAEDDGFNQYVNLAGGNSFGFEIVLQKKYSHNFSGKISYSYMQAKGLSGNTDQGMNYFIWGFSVPNEEFFLSWDQRHTVVGEMLVTLTYGIDINFLWRWNSPRPYTYFPSRSGYVPDLNIQMKPNNARMRYQAYADVKISKKWRISRQLELTSYLDIRNLFDKYNVLWIASDGRIGGELSDPSAWDIGRRINLGITIAFNEKR